MSDNLVDRIGKLIAIGDIDGAHALVAKTANAAEQELGRAQLALAHRDLEAGAAHARRAIELGAGGPGHHFLAVAKLMSGDADGAVDEARRAVGLDGSPKGRSSLGGILLAAGRPQDALAVLRQVASEIPDDLDTQLNLASAAAKSAEYGDAIVGYSRAFAIAPNDPRAIQNLMAMFAEAGRWLGAMAALDMSRKGEPPPEVAITLDLANLHIVRMVAGGKYPPAGMSEDADSAVQNLVTHSLAQPAAQQLVTVRTLLDLDRVVEAKQVLARVDRSKLDQPTLAGVIYIDGYIAEQDGDRARALSLYEQAVTTDGTRTDAATNAASLLLEDATPEALAKIGSILDKVAPSHRNDQPGLLYNEAIYLARSGKNAEARTCLERILRRTGGNGPLAERARQALADLGRLARA